MRFPLFLYFSISYFSVLAFFINKRYGDKNDAFSRCSSQYRQGGITVKWWVLFLHESGAICNTCASHGCLIDDSGFAFHHQEVEKRRDEMRIFEQWWREESDSMPAFLAEDFTEEQARALSSRVASAYRKALRVNTRPHGHLLVGEGGEAFYVHVDMVGCVRVVKDELGKSYRTYRPAGVRGFRKFGWPGQRFALHTGRIGNDPAFFCFNFLTKNIFWQRPCHHLQ